MGHEQKNPEREDDQPIRIDLPFDEARDILWLFILAAIIIRCIVASSLI